MSAAQDLIGRTIHGRFTITDVLGEGAMGVVYRAFDDEGLDEVAVKVLLPGHATSPDLLSRFQREGAAARRVDHEGAVRVIGRGCEAGIHYLVMELVDGVALADLLERERRFSEARAARIVYQLAGALAVAHERGVIHRDIKPANVMVLRGSTASGAEIGERVKLVDFGIAKPMAGASYSPAGPFEDSFESGSTTQVGALLGTPEYMAPEQCMSGPVDARTDVYACGAMLYRMVVGHSPFGLGEEDPFMICRRQIEDDPAPPRSIVPELSPGLERVILKALSKAPSERQQSATELRRELSEALSALERPAASRFQSLSSTVVMEAPPAYGAPSVALPHPRPLPANDSQQDLSFAATVLDAPSPASVAAPPPPAPLVLAPAPRSSRRHLWIIALAALVGAGIGTLLTALSPFARP